jgi:site-specific DNA recombinase
MVKVALYARYSSEHQRDASIEDQLRLCRLHSERQGWTVVDSYSDRAISGASLLRPAIQELIADAMKGRFQIVLSEAMDRLSRDQEDIAGLFKRMAFAGVKIVTLSEGEVTNLHVGLKGTMNAIFLKDLADKTRRGQEGRVRSGRSGGGLGFGYRVLRELDARGELIRGGLEIDEARASIVRQIFEEYAAGASPRAIAAKLNLARIPGPAGTPWGPSTIYGNWRRGTGILNNELYIGRRIWNRQRFVKDPDTGKRIPRYNSSDTWVVEEVQHLRIVDDELWRRAKERQKTIRGIMDTDGDAPRSERVRRPAYLLSNLLKCGVCGGGFAMRTKTHYACSNAHNRATCTNKMRIGRAGLEATVLLGLKTQLMRAEMVKDFITEYHSELNRLRSAEHQVLSAQRDELARTERGIRAIIEAIKDGIRSPGMREELLALEDRKEQLAATLKNVKSSVVRMHPNLAEIYREKVSNLHIALSGDDTRGQATEALRSLISEVRLIPENGRLEIELVGDLPAMLAFANGTPRRADPAGRITMVAGEGFEPPTLGL